MTSLPAPRAEWMPIESAPKDEFILFWCTDRVGKQAEREGGYARLGIFQEEWVKLPDPSLLHERAGGFATDGSWHPLTSVSHWLPLPSPPVSP